MAINQETVTGIQHHTDRLFTFQTTRNSGFRFDNGQFTMIGLDVDDKKILRAYSIASANYEDELNFISIKVQDGPLTSKLQHIKPGDQIEISMKAVGTLTSDRILPGRNLWLLATGTGLAPFMSIVKDYTIYEKFEKVILVHCTRTAKELLYNDYLKNLNDDDTLGEFIDGKFIYYPITTQDPDQTNGKRITDQFYTDELEINLGLPLIDSTNDRIMICGNPDFNNEMMAYLKDNDWKMGSMKEPGQFIIEKAFVD